MNDGLHCTYQERLSGPKHDRQRERQLDPAHPPKRYPGDIFAHHRECRDDDCQGQRPDKPPAKIHELWVHSIIERGSLRLERHAAYRAVAGVVLPHLRMHRTRVDFTDCGRGYDRG